MENIWIYEIERQAKGIVFAKSEYEAIETVVLAYKKHGDEIVPSDVTVEKAISSSNWMEDSPNVLEVADLN